jgi:DNA polymerase-3 subunit epsilon
MKITKPIVFFDIESTGINTSRDRIVELQMIKVTANGEEEWYSKFNPHPVVISDEAASVHGISNEDVMDAPKFEERANEILAFIEGCDLAGYNIQNFDVPMLFEEFCRANILFDWKRHRLLDAYALWTYFEPRTLTGAVERFLGEKFENAHSAKWDVDATKRVFFKQMETYNFSEEDFDDVIEKSKKDNRIDLTGKFVKKDNNIFYGFGKYNGKSVTEINKVDPGYLDWIANKSELSMDCKMIAKKLITHLNK